MNNFKNFFLKNSLYFAWIVSIIATSGSLYLSEVLKYEPCLLCWFQRIFMYPQVILFSIALFTNDRSVIKYILPISIIGGSISIYHYCLQIFPNLENIAPCTGKAVSCLEDYLNWFGFITIPLLALIAFILIITFSLISRKYKEIQE